MFGQQPGFHSEPLTPRELAELWALWPVVRKWPRLRGEPKLTWLRLYELSRCGREQIRVTPTAIAYEQGCSDSASGRRSLHALLDAGLIRVRDRLDGLWSIEFDDPRQVVRARKRAGDPQFVLFELEEDESTEHVDDAPGGEAKGVLSSSPPPRPAAGPSIARATRDQRPEARGRTNQPALGLVRTEPAAPSLQTTSASAQEIGAMYGALVGRFTDDVSQAERINALTRWLLKHLDDPKTRFQALAPVVAAVIDGRIKRERVFGALADTQRKRRAGEITKSPGAYFMRALQRLCHQAGVEPPGDFRPRPTGQEP